MRLVGRYKYLAWDFYVGKEEIVVGRNPDCGIRIQVPFVSRRHARLFTKEGKTWVEDLHSTAGTRINGIQLQPGEAMPLALGDRLFIGQIKLLFEAERRATTPTGRTQLFDSIVGALNHMDSLVRFKGNVEARLRPLENKKNRDGLARVLEELECYHDFAFKRLQEYVFLQEISRVSAMILNTRDLLKAMLELSTQFFGAERGFIVLYDAETMEPDPQYTHYYGSDRLKSSDNGLQPFSQTICKACFGQNEIVILEDAASEQHFKGAKSIMFSNIRSVACIPISQYGTVYGVIYLDSTAEPGLFTEDRRSLLCMLGEQTAVFLEKARLLAEAISDPLTQIYNRKYMFQRLREEIVRCGRQSLPLGLLMVDLDHFKSVNDTYGHLAGDAVLCQFATLLEECCRATDLAGRYGGEEFLIIFPETDLEVVASCAERLRRMVASQRFTFGNDAISKTASFGIAFFDGKRGMVDAQQLVDEADQALYAAKNGGRNRVVCFGDLVLGHEEMGTERLYRPPADEV